MVQKHHPGKQLSGHVRSLRLCKNTDIEQEGAKFNVSNITAFFINFDFSFYRKNGPIYIQRAQNILGNIPADVLYRIDVDFRIEETNLDSFIGRTAHIQFLEC